MRFSILAMVFALLVTGGPARGQAPAWQPLHFDVSGGIQALVTDRGGVLLQTATGTWHRPRLRQGALGLTAASPPQATPMNDPDALPDTEIAHGRRDIEAAWFARPTGRYGHGVLGDAIEAGALKARIPDGRVLELVLAEDAVFEDRLPRLADVDGDGRDEIIAVKSYLDRGAALVLAGIVDDTLQILAEAPAIGLAHRWLNPAGTADFDGDGRVEIAAVITPHIGGTLRLYEWQGGALVADHSAFGFSNHAMGSRELGLSAVLDLDRDGVADILLPDAGRRVLLGLSFAAGAPRTILRLDAAGDFGSGLQAADLDGDGRMEVIYATRDNRLTVLKARP